MTVSLFLSPALSENAKKTYRYAWQQFLLWATDYLGREFRLEDLNTDLLVAYDQFLADTVSRSTRKTKQAALLHCAEQLDMRGQTPAGLDIQRLRRAWKSRNKYNQDSSMVLGLDELRIKFIPKVLAYYQALTPPPLPENVPAQRQRAIQRTRLIVLRNKAFVEVLYATAARVSEVLGLEAAQVASGQSTAYITGKGGKQRLIYLRREEARTAIALYLEERKKARYASKWLFPSHSNNNKGGRMTPKSAQQIISAALGAMDDYPKTLGKKQGISPHDFRHYRATQLLRSGMPLEVVQEYLGHESIETTRRVYAPVLGQAVIERALDSYDTTPR